MSVCVFTFCVYMESSLVREYLLVVPFAVFVSGMKV